MRPLMKQSGDYFTLEGYYLSQKPLADLLNNLRQEGINIDLNASEKRVSYEYEVSTRKTVSVKYTKKTTVPLTTRFPRRSNPKNLTFYLRDGNGLRLELFGNQPPSKDQPASGITTILSDYKPLAQETINHVRRAMERTYHQHSLEGDLQMLEAQGFKVMGVSDDSDSGEDELGDFIIV